LISCWPTSSLSVGSSTHWQVPAFLSTAGVYPMRCDRFKFRHTRSRPYFSWLQLQLSL